MYTEMLEILSNPDGFRDFSVYALSTRMPKYIKGRPTAEWCTLNAVEYSDDPSSYVSVKVMLHVKARSVIHKLAGKTGCEFARKKMSNGTYLYKYRALVAMNQVDFNAKGELIVDDWQNLLLPLVGRYPTDKEAECYDDMQRRFTDIVECFESDVNEILEEDVEYGLSTIRDYLASATKDFEPLTKLTPLLKVVDDSIAAFKKGVSSVAGELEMPKGNGDDLFEVVSEWMRSIWEVDVLGYRVSLRRRWDPKDLKQFLPIARLQHPDNHVDFTDSESWPGLELSMLKSK